MAIQVPLPSGFPTLPSAPLTTKVSDPSPSRQNAFGAKMNLFIAIQGSITQPKITKPMHNQSTNSSFAIIPTHIGLYYHTPWSSQVLSY